MKAVVVEYGRDEERGIRIIPCDTMEEAQDASYTEQVVADLLGQEAYVSIRDMSVSDVLAALRLDGVTSA